MYDEWSALHEAHDAARTALSLLTPDSLERPSRNEGWTVRDLANHLLGGNVRFTLLLAEAPDEALEATRTTDYVGADPVAEFDRTNAELVAAFKAPGALEKMLLTYRGGARPGRSLLSVRVFEAALHGWDIATSIGAPYELSDELCEWMLSEIGEISRLQELGVYAPATTAEGTPLQQLLARTGRA